MRIAILAIFLAGCASVTATPFNGPDGRAAYAVECGNSLDACYQKAGELCPTGWTMVDRATGTVMVPINGMLWAAPKHSLSVECKG